MELRDLGFDRWYRKQQKELGTTEYRVARVTAVDRNGYIVRNGKSEVPADLTGRLRRSAESSADLPCVGDWAFVQYHDADTHAMIHGLFHRKTVLRRKAAGKKLDYQFIAANIDIAFIIQSCDFDFNMRRLERYLVMVNEGRIKPLLLLSKSDLISPLDLEQRISRIKEGKISSRVLALSNKTGFGLDQVQHVLKKGKTYCLLGSSGVGKTTLLNNLMGREAFETKSVREKDSKGRHATTRRQLIVLNNGAMLIDNPGMRELGIIGDSTGLDESFSDIAKLSKRCRFRDCSHIKEISCAILMAVETGELSKERYRSYLKLIRESEHHQMSYSDKRRKDREFGKMVKSVMKHKRKR